MSGTTERARLTAGFSVAAVSVLLLGSILSGTVSGVEPGDAPPPTVLIEQFTIEDDEATCESWEDAVSVEYVDDPEPAPFGSFQVIITLDAPLCEPVEAVAAAYLMPPRGNPWPADWWEVAQDTWWPNFFPPIPDGFPAPPTPDTSYAWPQELATYEYFTLGDAGDTVITFLKGCDPLQFDVIRSEGAGVDADAPQFIDPASGDMHGPLLFPPTYGFGAGGSAVQYYPPRGCDRRTTTDDDPGETTTTTTTTASTTTTTASATTSTPPTIVENSTSIAPSPATANVPSGQLAFSDPAASQGGSLAFAG